MPKVDKIEEMKKAREAESPLARSGRFPGLNRRAAWQFVGGATDEK